MLEQDTVKCSYKKLASFNHYQNNEFIKNDYLYEVILSNAKCCYNAIQNVSGYILAIVYNYSKENNKIILDFTAGLSETIEYNERIPDALKRGLGEEVGIIIKDDLFNRYQKNGKIKICRQTFNQDKKRTVYMSHTVAINIDNLTDDNNLKSNYDPCMSSYISLKEMKEYKNNVHKTCMFIYSKSRERIEQKLSEINTRLSDNDNIFGVACISCNYMKYLYNMKFNNKTNIILSEDDKIIDLYQRIDIKNIETNNKSINIDTKNMEMENIKMENIKMENIGLIENKENMKPNVEQKLEIIEIIDSEISNINLDIIEFLESFGSFDNFENNFINSMDIIDINDTVNNCINILNNELINTKLTKNQKRKRKQKKYDTFINPYMNMNKLCLGSS
ncbi:hypothetical protein Hokovirus_1_105 [Hokovirus HKV1]|uniref:Uncharacterized protein n=1 Tax=Hokovirus HKV1 TaxID=1977638 RepID=A0A1V0SET3_9VIRU|nr:hypothetical protein Hokovirus_1_105 [Hokovirus HKV1]